MPIAFNAPANAPQGAHSVHPRRDVEDDASAADAFTMLLLAAKAVDDAAGGDEAVLIAPVDAAAGASGAATNDAATPLLGLAPSTAAVDPAIEAARAAAVAVRLPPAQPVAAPTRAVTIVASERLGRAGAGMARSDGPALAAPFTAAATNADAATFATARTDGPQAEPRAATSRNDHGGMPAELRADAPRAAAAAAAASAAATAFAAQVPASEAPAEAKRQAPGRAAPVDGASPLAATDGAYLRPAANAPAVHIETIATPAFTPGWQDEAVSRMAHVVLTRNERAELTLHPAELGPVSIRVDMQDDQARLTIVAASAETRSALEQSLPQLRDLLASQGITLGQASVHDGSARRDDAPATTPGGGKAPREPEAAPPVVGTTWTVRPARGRVDLFA